MSETEQLPAEQQTALELLVGGKPVAETARQVGVSRSTVFRWLQNDAVFRAAYNAWQEEIRSSCQSRLTAMTAKATDALEKSLENGDGRLALQVLKGMGMIKERAAEPTDAEEIRQKDALELRKKKNAHRMEVEGAALAELLS